MAAGPLYKYTDGVPMWKKDEGEVYYDRQTQGVSSAWNPGKAPKITDVNHLCPHPLEHFDSVFSPEAIGSINRARREEARTNGCTVADLPPTLKFGFFVVHKSEGFLIKRRTPYCVVNIGQSVSVSHNFLEPVDVHAFYDIDGGGKRKCKCQEFDRFEVPPEIMGVKVRDLVAGEVQSEKHVAI